MLTFWLTGPGQAPPPPTSIPNTAHVSTVNSLAGACPPDHSTRSALALGSRPGTAGGALHSPPRTLQPGLPTFSKPSAPRVLQVAAIRPQEAFSAGAGGAEARVRTLAAEAATLPAEDSVPPGKVRSRLESVARGQGPTATARLAEPAADEQGGGVACLLPCAPSLATLVQNGSLTVAAGASCHSGVSFAAAAAPGQSGLLLWADGNDASGSGAGGSGAQGVGAGGEAGADGAVPYARFSFQKLGGPA
jgi:hypothetical protein